MTPLQWALLSGGVVLFLLFYSLYSGKKREAELVARLKKEWGTFGKRKSSAEQYDNISHFFLNSMEGENVVDDITWNDLDMDRLFMAANTTNSSVGQECLYRMFRIMEHDPAILQKRDAQARYFAENQQERLKLQKIYARTGYCKAAAYFDYVRFLSQLSPSGNGFHYLLLAANVMSLACAFFWDASAGLMAFIVCVMVDITSYYKALSSVQPFFSCVKVIVRMMRGAEKIVRTPCDVLTEETARLSELVKELSFLCKKARYISSSSSMDGSLAGTVLDYVKMITHIDLMKFNQLVRQIGRHQEKIMEFSKCMGDVEAVMAIASFREAVQRWCVPELQKSKTASLCAKGMVHPLIENAVANSVEAQRGVLLTGSNASGKSTFIKTAAINAILAQTLATACADAFTMSYCRVMSSMALSDDLENNESYYMVEIRSLKRILDACKQGGLPVLCMIDEVLRGTNTVERIAASSQILKALSRPGALCFAATHDVELTMILKDWYDNYHFQEEVGEAGVSFPYLLKKGPAATRNAIRLLKMMGYDEEIVEEAEKMAESLTKNGGGGP